MGWPTCSQRGCIGIRLARNASCLAHATDQDRKAALKQLSETGAIDVSGVPIGEALLEQIISAAPHDTDNRPAFTAVRFDRASFKDSARFDRASFRGIVGFDGASFQGNARFDGASFQGNARFDGASFQGTAGFDGASFQGTAWFSRASFQGTARFDRASFQGDAWFSGAIFKGTASFSGASFDRAQQLGPLLAYRGLVLDRVEFTQPVQIEAATLEVCCRGARFAGGVQFRLRWSRVTLDDTDLAAPCIVAHIPGLADEHLSKREQRIARAWQLLLGDGVSARPRVLSLRRANVAGLSLAGVDLADCRFGGAHNLDKLRFEADVSFGLAPARLAWDWRHVIADERAWRAQRTRRWVAPVYPGWVDAWLGQRRPSVLEPAQIAGLYRCCAKGAKIARTSLARLTSTTARWRCVATPTAAVPAERRAAASSVAY